MLLQALVSAAGVTVLGPSKDAAPFEPVKGFAPTPIVFDDRQGKGFEWTKKLPCGANHAIVTIKFDKSYAEQSGGNTPVAKVWVHSGQPGTAAEHWIAESLKAPTDAWGLNGLAWVESVKGSSSEGVGGYMPEDMSHPVKIDLDWTSAGGVNIGLDSEAAKHVATDQPITDIGVGGSWAKFEFINLQVGRVGPADAACYVLPANK